jgi:branched-subunit amino acid aminotransferase/4-amino-4-deoxychorismate lyase
MAEPIAYLNGEWMPISEARLSVADYGVVQAATVTEMIRTFGFKPFRVDAHLQRLRHSLSVTGIADPQCVNPLAAVIERLVAENSRLLPAASDLAIVTFVTAGMNPMYAGLPAASPQSPTVCVHSFPLPFARWAPQYEQGVHLRVPSIPPLPSAIVDPRVKHRSRLHWFLADREVRRHDPAAMAILADWRGRLTETHSGNLILFDGDRLRTPPAERILGGISQQVVIELASAAGIPHVAEDLTAADVTSCREAMLSSTGYCLLPVTSFNDEHLGQPGPLFRQLLADWSKQVGTDIILQAQQAAGFPPP